MADDQRSLAERLSVLLAFSPGIDQPVALRNVRENPVSVTARLSSIKLGRMVQAESLLEYDLLNIMEFDPRVAWYAEQRLAIPITLDNGSSRLYHPDVVVGFDIDVLRKLGEGSFDIDGSRTERFRATVYEVKPHEVLRKHWERFRPKFQQAREVLAEHGVRFRVVTEHDIDRTFARNAQFLNGFKTVGGQTGVDSAYQRYDEALLEAAWREKSALTVQQLLDLVSYTDAEMTKLIPRLWRLVASCHLDAELTRPLTMSTPVWSGQLFSPDSERPSPRWRQRDHDWHR